MSSLQRNFGLWQGFLPPQYIFSNRRFKGIVLDPPDLNPGSWIGAGKAVFDSERGEFLLTARPRKAEGGVRGFAAHIYRSGDGEEFELLTSLSKEEVSEKSGLQIHSIEGTQLLRDPLSGRFHFYLSVDTGASFVWGGLYWETLLLTARDLNGLWKSEGLVLRNDQAYDSYQARDATIDIVDGVWLCLYKAIGDDRWKRPALAISSDGVSWQKRGPLTVEGADHKAFLSGSLFAGTGGPLFVGLETPEETDLEKRDDVYADKHQIGHGGGMDSNFAAYYLDVDRVSLKPIFCTPWEPGSPYEHKSHPLLGYASVVYDPIGDRILTYVEAIDGELTEQIGLNETVERLLLYETPCYGMGGEGG